MADSDKKAIEIRTPKRTIFFAPQVVSTSIPEHHVSCVKLVSPITREPEYLSKRGLFCQMLVSQKRPPPLAENDIESLSNARRSHHPAAL